ncbi:ANR family transcriptional regulator [Vibrio parahaemolyticus]|nr:ANR family transcriptional regulator [Vibrio parahaemolyticus]EJE8775159.1 ANR family transcriptional regulator [Vibrio parahaemolyticus]
MKERYLELARKACAQEKRTNWKEASFLWMQSIEFAVGADIKWANDRFEFCYRRG